MKFLLYILAITLIYIVGLIIFGFWDFIKFLSTNKRKLLKSLKMNLWEFKFGKSFLFIPNFIMEILTFEEFALFDIFDFLINVKVNIYENGIECVFSFYKWGEFKDYKIEGVCPTWTFIDKHPCWTWKSSTSTPSGFIGSKSSVSSPVTGTPAPPIGLNNNYRCLLRSPLSPSSEASLRLYGIYKFIYKNFGNKCL